MIATLASGHPSYSPTTRKLLGGGCRPFPLERIDFRLKYRFVAYVRVVERMKRLLFMLQNGGDDSTIAGPLVVNLA